jgi:hypothetical protein
VLLYEQSCAVIVPAQDESRMSYAAKQEEKLLPNTSVALDPTTQHPVA